MSRRSSRNRKSYAEPSVHDIPYAPSDSEEQEQETKKEKVKQKAKNILVESSGDNDDNSDGRPHAKDAENQSGDQDMEDDFSVEEMKAPKRKRGKSKKLTIESEDDQDMEDDYSGEEVETPKRKRGKVKKLTIESEDDQDMEDDYSVEEVETPKRKRGKSKKIIGTKEERTCPSCNKVFTILAGLEYHEQHKVCQNPNRRRLSVSPVGTIPLDILSIGQTFITKFGVVRVVKDDRAGKDFGKTKITKKYSHLNKSFKRKCETNKNREGKVYLFVAKRGRQKRNILLQHYLNHKEQNCSEVGTSGTPSQEYADGIWNTYYPLATPPEIFSGTFKKSLALPYITVGYPDDVGKNPAAPADSYPERIVECVLIEDERKRVHSDAKDGGGKLSLVAVGKDLVGKTQHKLKTGGERDQTNKNDDNASEPLHESGMRLFIKRNELMELYTKKVPIYSCATCGKNFAWRNGLKAHIGNKICINETAVHIKSRMVRLQAVEDSINDVLKAPCWILPPLKAPPGGIKRKRCRVLPGWLVFHHEKSSLYPQVFKQLKLKRGSNNSKFVQKTWDVIGPGRKKSRKSRARRHSVMSVVHQVSDWMDLSDHAVYPGVMAVLFPTTDKRQPPRRAAGRRANNKVSQYLGSDEEDNVNVKEEEYNPEEESDLQVGDDFFPSEDYDAYAPMPPLPSPTEFGMKETMPPPTAQPFPVDRSQASASSFNTNRAPKRDKLANVKEGKKATEEPPKKKRRRKKTDTAITTKPLAPIIVDIRPLVEEVRAGRYPSMQVYNGEHLNICMLCKTQDDKVLNCEFCTNSEHLGCLKSKVTIRDPEPDDEFMCHRCVQTVLARRSRAEKRRLDKLNSAIKGNGSTSPGVSLEQAKDAAMLKREVIWSQAEFGDHVASYSKCPTGGPGGLICCGPCTASYSRLLSETAKEMEVQTLSGVGREVSELLELLHDAQVRLQQAVDISNSNGIRRDMLRDGDEQLQSTRDRNSSLLGIIDIFNNK
eukprot:scaffold4843_cov266-Chaetoceros_neogracile.AAC.19